MVAIETWPLAVSTCSSRSLERHLRCLHGGFRLRDPVKLLFAWGDAYRFERQERRGYFTLLRGKKLRDALASFVDWMPPN